METAAPPPSLARTFANDIAAIDADRVGNKFVIVSRGGNQVFRATLDPATGELNILNKAGEVEDCRVQTGNLPSGVAMRRDGTRAYANNEANFSVTSMNVDNGFPHAATRHRLCPASRPWQLRARRPRGQARLLHRPRYPGQRYLRHSDPRVRSAEFPWQAIARRLEQLWVVPSGRAGRWRNLVFGTGPRQTIPLDGMFSKQNPDDQRVLNWSAVRGSNTDFNANSRATQGGCGFASVVFTGDGDGSSCPVYQ